MNRTNPPGQDTKPLSPTYTGAVISKEKSPFRARVIAAVLAALTLGGAGLLWSSRDSQPENPFVNDPAEALHGKSPTADQGAGDDGTGLDGGNATSPSTPLPTPTQPPAAAPVSPAPKTIYVPTMITVHVAGMVKRPGVYTLPAMSRVSDAIRKAGGANRGADVNALNLAEWVQDGARIEVLPLPTPENGRKYRVSPETHANSFASGPSTAISSPNLPSSPPGNMTTNGGAWNAETANSAASGNAGNTMASPTMVDLNRASLSELDTIPNIGPTRAQRIIDYRERNGGFRSVDELTYIPGIGDKLLAKIRPYVCISS